MKFQLIHAFSEKVFGLFHLVFIIEVPARAECAPATAGRADAGVGFTSGRLKGGRLVWARWQVVFLAFLIDLLCIQDLVQDLHVTRFKRFIYSLLQVPSNLLVFVQCVPATHYL